MVGTDDERTRKTAMAAKTPSRAPAAFKAFNRFMLLLWRLGLGGPVNRVPRWSGQIMVLVHRGRVSGVIRRTPVNYALSDDDIFCIVGFGTTDWYRNIRADPHVEVWLPDGWWAGVADELPREHPDRLPRLRQVLLASGLAASAAGANPRALNDADLQDRTEVYRVIRIHRTAARTGPDGPGELAWIWPVATVLLGTVGIRATWQAWKTRGAPPPACERL
jgi:deazaflavin-dependent oxidoreductase (nitroreductase family)